MFKRIACLLLLAAVTARAQTLGPAETPWDRLAKTALSEAQDLVTINKTLPRESLFDIGLMWALSGELSKGLQTICGTPDATGPGGPRWAALVEVGHTLAARGKAGPVQRAAEKQAGADRAALLVGLAQAQFEAGEDLAAMLNLQEVANAFPAVAAELMVARAESVEAEGGEPATELLSRTLDAARKIPPAQRQESGSVQAAVLTRLAMIHVRLEKDAAALQAVEAVADPDDRQAPLLALTGAQAAGGRYAAALDTATKAGSENADPATEASRQVTGYAIVARAAAAHSDAAAGEAARRAAESAKGTVDNYIRVRSLILAAEAHLAAETGAGAALLTQALADLHVTDQGQRARALAAAARAQVLAGQSEPAQTTFASALEVAALARDERTADAVVMAPASLGLVDLAERGLALRQEPEALLRGRLLLARTLAEEGFAKEAEAALGKLDLGKRAERLARMEGLCQVAERLAGGSDERLLRDSLRLAADPFDPAGVRRVAATAAGKGLAAVALEAFGAAVEGMVKSSKSYLEVGADELLAAVRTALARSAAAGADLSALTSAAAQAAMAAGEPMVRAAGLSALGSALAELGQGVEAERLLATASVEARRVTPEARMVQALCEHGAVAGLAGFPALADSSFSAARGLLDVLDAVSPPVLLAYAECEAEVGRKTAGVYLLRSVLTLPGFGRDGSTDLRRLGRVAGYQDLWADALAMARRVDRPNERLAALLDVARNILARPMLPLRARDVFALPDSLTVAAG